MELLPPFLWGMDPLFHVPLQLMICQIKNLIRISDLDGMAFVPFATKEFCVLGYFSANKLLFDVT